MRLWNWGKNGPRGGPDLVTLPPDLLDGLRKTPFMIRSSPSLVEKEASNIKRSEPRYFSCEGPSTPQYEATYTEDLAKERIALEKVPEGLAKFSVDAAALQDLLRNKIRSRIEASTRL